MVITIDVGNTNITVGVFRGDEVMASFRITTKMPRTSDEYGMLLSNLLEQNKIRHDDIEDAIIASVVPNVMHSLEGAIIKYFGINPIIVEPGTKTGIRGRSVQTVSWMRQQHMSCMADRYWYLILALPLLMIWSIKTEHLFSG